MECLPRSFFLLALDTLLDTVGVDLVEVRGEFEELVEKLAAREGLMVMAEVV